MIEYRMMDETCLLCYCLHGGPIPVEETRTPEPRPIAIELWRLLVDPAIGFGKY